MHTITYCLILNIATLDDFSLYLQSRLQFLDKNDQASQTKNGKALSGGEQSFTTLSLLLAIGESLETVSQ